VVSHRRTYDGIGAAAREDKPASVGKQAFFDGPVDDPAQWTAEQRADAMLAIAAKAGWTVEQDADVYRMLGLAR
jgi:hypothetical protein